jgi:hypothetical protein
MDIPSSTPFSDIGIHDLELGTELYRVLQLKPYELTLPGTSGMLREISDYLSKHPSPIGLLSSVARSNRDPGRSQLEHLASYVKLANNRAEIKSKLEELDKQLSYYG